MGERSYAWRVVREPLGEFNPEPVVRYRFIETGRDGVRRVYRRADWGDTLPDLARLLGDMAEALTRPVLVERDGRLEEDTP